MSTAASAALTSNTIARFAETFVPNPAVTTETAQRIIALLAIQLPINPMYSVEDVKAQTAYVLHVLTSAQALQFLADAVSTVAANYLDRMKASAQPDSFLDRNLYLPQCESRPGHIFFNLPQAIKNVRELLGDLDEEFLTTGPH